MKGTSRAIQAFDQWHDSGGANGAGNLDLQAYRKSPTLWGTGIRDFRNAKLTTAASNVRAKPSFERKIKDSFEPTL